MTDTVEVVVDHNAPKPISRADRTAAKAEIAAAAAVGKAIEAAFNNLAGRTPHYLTSDERLALGRAAIKAVKEPKAEHAAAAWAAGTTYVFNNVVSYQGANWISLVNDNLGNTPAEPSTFWAKTTPGPFVASGKPNMDHPSAPQPFFPIGGPAPVDPTVIHAGDPVVIEPARPV
jgi:hypothetical protein